MSMFSLCLLVSQFVGAGLALGGEDVSRAEGFREVEGLEGFSSRGGAQSLEAASLSDAASLGADGAGQLAWGQAMLEDLERLQKEAGGDPLARVEDVFAFREWCLKAPGKGNLVLAVAAEDTAATLLFRALAQDQSRGEEIRRLFAKCKPNGLTADYWLETLAMEGIAVDCGDALKDEDPEHVRLETFWNAYVAMQGEGYDMFHFLRPDRTWNGCTDAFVPEQAMFRAMLIARKEISLGICLEICEKSEDIPEEIAAFIGAANKYADDALHDRDRFSESITPHEVWRHWAAALEEANRK